MSEQKLQEQEHPLVTKRAQGAVAVLAMATTLGIALMSFHLLIWGLLTAFAGVAGAIWIYGADFAHLRLRLLSPNGRLISPPRELTVLVVLIAAAVIVPSGIFLHEWISGSESAHLAMNRVVVKGLIGTAIKEGEALTKDWDKREAESFEHETNFWTNRIGHLVEDAYGEGEARLLMSDAGFIAYTDGKKQTETRNWIIHRLQRLNELIPRVDSLAMRPTFDPKNYHWADKCAEC
jgi:hypothetical protein